MKLRQKSILGVIVFFGLMVLWAFGVLHVGAPIAYSP
jgi:hypothetical protein